MREIQEEDKGSLVLHLRRKEEDRATRWSGGIRGGTAWVHDRQVKEGMEAGRGGDKRRNGRGGGDII